MTAIFAFLKVVPLWVWIAAAALLAIGVQTSRLEMERTRYAEYVAQVEKNTADQQAAARAEEQRRANESQQVQAHAKQSIDQAQADAAAKSAASGQLRDQLAKLQRQLSGSPVDTGVARRGASAARSAMVLSDLLQRADQRATELAAVADQSRIRGSTCERLYDSLTARK